MLKYLGAKGHGICNLLSNASTKYVYRVWLSKYGKNLICEST